MSLNHALTNIQLYTAPWVGHPRDCLKWVQTGWYGLSPSNASTFQRRAWSTRLRIRRQSLQSGSCRRKLAKHFGGSLCLSCNNCASYYATVPLYVTVTSAMHQIFKEGLVNKIAHSSAKSAVVKLQKNTCQAFLQQFVFNLQQLCKLFCHCATICDKRTTCKYVCNRLLSEVSLRAYYLKRYTS